CGGHRDRHLAIKIGPVALEEFMRLDREEDVKVARRSAARSRLALTGQTDTGSILDTGRTIDRKRAFLRHAALTMALAAGILDDLAATVTGRAGALDREEAL